MKKLLPRMAACSLAVLIAFNTVAIPKAEAVITESALVSAFVATYSAAAGFAYRGESFPGTEQMPAVVRSIETFIEDFAEAREMTKAQFEAEINAGVKFIGDGVVKVGSAAAGLLASFIDWLVDLFALEPGGAVVTLNRGAYMVDADGNYFYFSTPSTIGTAFTSLSDFSYNGRTFSNKSYYGSSYVACWFEGSEVWKTSYSSSAFRSADFYTLGYELISEDSTKTYDYLHIYAYNADGYVDKVSYGWGNDPATTLEDLVKGLFGAECDAGGYSLAVSLPADYEAAPTVDEQYAMVIDTGMTIEDEQDFVDSVLGGMLAGTLAPTYSIEQAAGGDVVVPDEGEDTDTQAGILSTVKNIAQSVISLPQAIAEAIKGLFVPDAALTQEITDTFSAKFDFISNLHGLGIDLLNLDPEQTPPVIYIHLEDAGSNYGYTYGGTTKALDMAWYEPYKEDVDRIISGFLWLGFLWLCFMRASDIINGAGMVYAAGQPTIYTPDSLHDAPRLEAPRWRRRGR